MLTFVIHSQHAQLLLILGCHPSVPFLFEQNHQLLENTRVGLLLSVALKQVVLHLAPIPHLGIDVSQLQSFL